MIHWIISGIGTFFRFSAALIRGKPDRDQSMVIKHFIQTYAAAYLWNDCWWFQHSFMFMRNSVFLQDNKLPETIWPTMKTWWETQRDWIRLHRDVNMHHKHELNRNKGDSNRIITRYDSILLAVFHISGGICTRHTSIWISYRNSKDRFKTSTSFFIKFNYR